MNQLIDAAMAANPPASSSRFPIHPRFSGAVRRAERAGIPVISINSGADAFIQLGILVPRHRSRRRHRRAQRGDRLTPTGHEPVVLERAPKLEAVGAGITLFANAMNALAQPGSLRRSAQRDPPPGAARSSPRTGAS